MRTEMELGVMLPQTKECLELLAAGEGKEGFSPGDFRGSLSHNFISDLWTPEL